MASIFQNALMARQAGFGEMQDFRQARAGMEAGNALMGGDYQKAAGAFYGAGMTDAGYGVQRIDQANKNRQFEQEKAAKTAEATAKAAKLKEAVALAEGLGRVPAGQRLRAIQGRTQVLTALGVPPDQIASMREEDLSDDNLALFREQMKQAELEFIKGSDGTWAGVDKTSGRVIASGMTPARDEYKEFDPQKELRLIPGSGATTQQQPAGGFDAFYGQYLAPAEGGYAPNDGNGAPVNFGINQGSNPDVDVKNLTQDRAKALTYERYWKPSGADQLPPGLAEIQADTAFNMGVETAKGLLEKSGGDPQRYLQLREDRYRAIAQANPDKARYLPAWLNRNQQLAQYVGGAGRGAQPAPNAPAMPQLVRPAQAAPIDPKEALQMEALQGQITEQQTKAQEAQLKAQRSADAIAARSTLVNETVTSALSLLGRGEAGFVGAKMAGVPGTKAYDLSRQIETIKANLGFDQLQEMRANSPTGGALGAVSDRELVSLQAAVASLDIGQSEQQLRANLQKIRGHYKRWSDAVQQANGGQQAQRGVQGGQAGADFTPAQRQAAQRFKGATGKVGTAQRPYAPRSEQEYNNLPSGSHYIHPNGQIKVKR